MHALRRSAVRAALAGLLVIGGAACSGDGGDGGEAEVETQVSDPLNATE